MTSSRYPQITDELLSAYIDDAITKEEKALIETAIIDEPAIAWRVETLRYTINLLSSLPAVTLPRSFALSEFQATGQVGARAAQADRAAVAQEPARRIQASLHNLGERWRNFWQIGNLFLRNATAVSLAIFLALIVSNEFLAQSTLRGATMNRPNSSSGAVVQSNEQSVEPPKISPTTLAQASTARAVNSPSPTLAQPTIASQSAAAKEQAAPADSEADSAAEPSTTAAEIPEVAAAAAPASDAARAGAPNQEDPGTLLAPPGPDKQGLDQGEFAPAAPPANAPAMPPSAAASIQMATTAPSSKQPAPAAPTAIATPTLTLTATVEIMANNAQSQATVEATQPAPTLTPSATKLAADSNQAENVQTVTVPQANGAQQQWSWLALAQVMSAFVTLILGTLWWRSGESHYRVRRQQRNG